MVTAFSSRSTPTIRPQFPAISHVVVRDPLLRGFLATLQIQPIGFPDLRYLHPQLFNAFSDGLLDDRRLAGLATSHFHCPG